MAVDPIDLIRLAENGSDWLRPALTGWDRLGPARTGINQPVPVKSVGRCNYNRSSYKGRKEGGKGGRKGGREGGREKGRKEGVFTVSVAAETGRLTTERRVPVAGRRVDRRRRQRSGRQRVHGTSALALRQQDLRVQFLQFRLHQHRQQTKTHALSTRQLDRIDP